MEEVGGREIVVGMCCSGVVRGGLRVLIRMEIGFRVVVGFLV